MDYKNLFHVRNELLLRAINRKATKADFAHLKDVTDSIFRLRRGLRLKKVHDILSVSATDEFRHTVVETIHKTHFGIEFDNDFIDMIMEIMVPFFAIVVPQGITSYGNGFDNSLNLELCMDGCILTFTQEEDRDEWSWVCLRDDDGSVVGKTGLMSDPYYVNFGDILAIYGLDRFFVQLNNLECEDET